MALSEHYNRFSEANVVYKKLHRVREIFQDHGIDAEEDDVKAFSELEVGDLPKKPKFPWLILLVAIFKDISDIVEITVVGEVYVLIATFICSSILFFWSWGKVNQRWLKQGGLKMLAGTQFTKKWWGRFVVGTVLEFIPIVDLFPFETFFVLMGHYSETKTVKFINFILEEVT